MDMTYEVMVDGVATADVVVLDEPLSMWGGFDSGTGTIIDVRHPQHGLVLKDKIIVMTSGRGSSSASTVLAEAMRRGTAPAAFILEEADPILVIGSLVGKHLYNVSCPIVVGPPPPSGRVHVDGAAVESL